MKNRTALAVVRNSDEARPRFTTSTASDGAILVRIEAAPTVEAPDDLVPFPFGIEASAARKLVREGLLVAAKIGRRTYAKRSAVLALVDKLASRTTAAPEDAEDAYRAMVRRASR
jgi:hypothetical protein